MSYCDKLGMLCLMIVAAIVLGGFMVCCFVICFSQTVLGMTNRSKPWMFRAIDAVGFVITLLMLVVVICFVIGILENTLCR